MSETAATAAADNQPFRDGEREFQESRNAFRGLFFGVLFSLPIWAILGLAVWGVVAFVNR